MKSTTYAIRVNGDTYYEGHSGSDYVTMCYPLRRFATQAEAEFMAQAFRNDCNRQGDKLEIIEINMRTVRTIRRRKEAKR